MSAARVSYGRRIDAMVAMSRDRSATEHERALAAQRAASALAAIGVSYLDVYPVGLPEVIDYAEYDRDDWQG